MKPHHHPDNNLLWDYASGSLREPVALVVATHLALCPICRTEVGRLENVAGALLESVDPEPVDDSVLDRTFARLDSVSTTESENPPATAGDDWIPHPLREYLGGPVSALNWDERRFGPSSVRLLPERPDFDTRLLRIRAGDAMPKHTHTGHEYTIVLRGGFTDDSGHFERGDVAFADGSTAHAPTADEGEDCYCLAVTAGSLQLVGPIGRILNPFVRY